MLDAEGRPPKGQRRSLTMSVKALRALKREEELARIEEFIADARSSDLPIEVDPIETDDSGGGVINMVPRPRTRADCANIPRPCPFVSCKYHLYLDQTPNGSIKLNFPKIDATALDAIPGTCALDVADDGGTTLENVAHHMNLTRERIRQIETRALHKIRKSKAMEDEK